jgi:hypothetical protein
MNRSVIGGSPVSAEGSNPGPVPASAPDRLVFPGDSLARLRDSLLAGAPLESAAFLVAREVATPRGGIRLVVEDVFHAPPDAYLCRTPTAIELIPGFVAQIVSRARDAKATLVLAHSHPFNGVVQPSSQDRAGESRLLPAVRRRLGAVAVGRLILGPDGLHAAVLLPGGDERGADVLGVGTRWDMHPNSRGVAEATPNSRYERQVLAFGEAGQGKLSALRVGIVGVGGTGSVVVQQLAHLGICRFLLIDPDRLDSTNLNRVAGSRAQDVGNLKVDVARRMILEINPAAEVTVSAVDVRDAAHARLLLDVDAFFCCTDTHGSRAVLNQLAYQFVVPAIDIGVAVQVSPNGEVTHVSGRVQMLAPGLACLLCGGVLDPESVRRDLLTDVARRADPYVIGEAIPQPAVISINSVASSLGVTMFLGAATGLPLPATRQHLRLETGIVSRVEQPAAQTCLVCSRAGALGRGDQWMPPGRALEPAVKLPSLVTQSPS